MRTTVVTTLIVVVLAGVAGWILLQAQTDAHAERQRAIRLSAERLRTLTKFALVRVANEGWEAMPYRGKAFVLTPFVRGDLDARRRENLEVIFSGGRGGQPLEGVDPARYTALRARDLSAGTGLGGLTDFAGWGGEPTCGADAKHGFPILADATIEGVVVIAYSSGAVRTHTYADLGVPANGPVVFGADSPAELLRCLSDQ